MEKKLLRLGHSPDPDDAFMFYGLAKGLLDTGPYRSSTSCRTSKPSTSAPAGRTGNHRNFHSRLSICCRPIRPDQLRQQHGRPIRPDGHHHAIPPRSPI